MKNDVMSLVGIDPDDHSVYLVKVSWPVLSQALKENSRIQNNENEWYREVVSMTPEEIDAVVIGDLHNSKVTDYQIELLGELTEVA